MPQGALFVSFDFQLLRAVEQAERLLKEGVQLELRIQEGQNRTNLLWKVLAPVFARIDRQLRELVVVQRAQKKKVREQHRKDHLVLPEREHQINHL